MNQQHTVSTRREIDGQIFASLINQGLTYSQAAQLVGAIVDGAIAHVIVDYPDTQDGEGKAA